jgi:hypothetical protein
MMGGIVAVVAAPVIAAVRAIGTTVVATKTVIGGLIGYANAKITGETNPVGVAASVVAGAVTSAIGAPAPAAMGAKYGAGAAAATSAGVAFGSGVSSNIAQQAADTATGTQTGIDPSKAVVSGGVAAAANTLGGPAAFDAAEAAAAEAGIDTGFGGFAAHTAAEGVAGTAGAAVERGIEHDREF